MRHLVRCRGGEWRIERRPGYRFTILRTVIDEKDAYWNAVPYGFFGTWGLTPGWLAIAWLCCEADPIEGPKFAAAILDAGPEDDTPALIACDHLGGLETLAKLEMQEVSFDKAESLEAEWEEMGWFRGRADFYGSGYPDVANLYANGPLASWCRHLIATRCVACGGRRDGEDRKELRAEAARELMARLEQGLSPDPLCTLCGFPVHPTPPALVIPEVVKVGIE